MTQQDKRILHAQFGTGRSLTRRRGPVWVREKQQLAWECKKERKQWYAKGLSWINRRVGPDSQNDFHHLDRWIESRHATVITRKRTNDGQQIDFDLKRPKPPLLEKPTKQSFSSWFFCCCCWFQKRQSKEVWDNSIFGSSIQRNDDDDDDVVRVPTGCWFWFWCRQPLLSLVADDDTTRSRIQLWTKVMDVWYLTNRPTYHTLFDDDTMMDENWMDGRKEFRFPNIIIIHNMMYIIWYRKYIMVFSIVGWCYTVPY